MAEKGKIPTPKSQRQLSFERQTPYIPPEGAVGFSPTGNPNEQVLQFDQRANQISKKGDQIKTFTVGLKDIDEAVVYYFNNIIRPQVIEDGNIINIPLSYTNGERWVQLQKEGYLRDANGKIMMPFISYQRVNIERNRTLTSKVDANFPYNYHVYESSFSKKNQYSSFNVVNNIKPIKEYHLVVVPDYITVSYDFILVTHYMEQANKIVESINYASDSYWGDPSKYKFKSYIDSFATSIDLPAGNERKITTKFSMKLHGYLIPDIIQKDLSSFKKLFNKNITKILFKEEKTSTELP
jgi:hypothetical protein